MTVVSKRLEPKRIQIRALGHSRSLCKDDEENEDINEVSSTNLSVELIMMTLFNAHDTWRIKRKRFTSRSFLRLTSLSSTMAVSSLVSANRLLSLDFIFVSFSAAFSESLDSTAMG
uniref:Uncharacterized protein n=1 Tax=Romanomermis culicivorax TaxID=13658 RepID=A0A915JTQ2_ROMCU